MSPSLDDPRAKVERAIEHLDALDREWKAFVELYPDRTTPDHAFDGMWHTITVRPLFDEPPPLRLGLICGDVVHNLRCALDHIVWQLVLAEGNKPTSRNAFPVCKEPEAFKSITNPRKPERSPLYGITKNGPAWKIIEGEQPYKCRELGKDPRANDLAVISELSNVDKHRTLLKHLYLSTPAQIADIYGWNPDARLLEHRARNPELSYESVTEIVRLRFCESGPDPQVHVKGSLSVNPMFGGSGAGYIQASLGVIKDFPIYVGGLIRKFEQFF